MEKGIINSLFVSNKLFPPTANILRANNFFLNGANLNAHYVHTVCKRN